LLILSATPLLRTHSAYRPDWVHHWHISYTYIV